MLGICNGMRTQAAQTLARIPDTAAVVLTDADTRKRPGDMIQLGSAWAFTTLCATNDAVVHITKAVEPFPTFAGVSSCLYKPPNAGFVLVGTTTVHVPLG